MFQIMYKVDILFVTAPKLNTLRLNYSFGSIDNINILNINKI